MRSNLGRWGVFRLFVRNLRLHGLPWKHHPAGSDERLWITDDWTDNYFHFLFDALPRLYTLRASTPNLPLLLPAFYAQRAFVSEALEALAQPVEYLPRDGLYYRTGPMRYANTAGEEYYQDYAIEVLREFARCLLAEGSEQGGSPNRLYLSRQAASTRRVANESEVVEILARYGYQPLQLEYMSLAQQVAAFQRASSVIAPHGAGMANLVFAPSGCRVLEIRAHGASNSIFQTLCHHLGHRHAFLECPASGRDPQFCDYTVSLEALREALG